MKTILWIFPRNLSYCGEQIGRNLSLYESGQPHGARLNAVCLLWNSTPRVISGVILPEIWGQEATRLNQVTYQPYFHIEKKWNKYLTSSFKFIIELIYTILDSDLVGSK